MSRPARECFGKRRFASWSEAQGQFRSNRTLVYPCRECQGFHLGNDTPKAPPMHERRLKNWRQLVEIEE
jgi:hypothetical protein